MVQQNSIGFRLNYLFFWKSSFFNIKNNYLLILLDKVLQKGLINFFFNIVNYNFKGVLFNYFFFLENKTIYFYFRFLLTEMKKKSFLIKNISFRNYYIIKEKKPSSIEDVEDLQFSSWFFFFKVLGRSYYNLYPIWNFFNKRIKKKKQAVFKILTDLRFKLVYWLDFFFMKVKLNLSLTLPFRLYFFFTLKWEDLFYNTLRFNFRNFLYLRFSQLVLLGLLIADCFIFSEVLYYLLAKIKNKKLQYKAIRQFNFFIKLFYKFELLDFKISGIKYTIKGRLRSRKRRSKKLEYMLGDLSLGRKDSIVLYTSRDILTVVGVYGFKLWIDLKSTIFEPKKKKKFFLALEQQILDRELLLKNIDLNLVTLVDNLKFFRKRL